MAAVVVLLFVLTISSGFGGYIYVDNYKFGTLQRVPTPDQLANATGHGSAHAPAMSGQSSQTGDSSGGNVLAARTSLRKLNCLPIGQKHTLLASASSPVLQKLAQYETVCGGAVVSTASFFVPTPKNTTQAKDYAKEVATTLKEFARFGIAPLVFMEPTNEGGILNLSSYKNGAYDTALQAYFAQLKSSGVTNPSMGTWVYFPEANLPIWGSVSASLFASNITKTVRFQKQVFPTSKASILLDSMTYPSATSWAGGQYKSLLPYVKNIPKGLLDSFGLQGFPWTPPAGQSGSLFTTTTYLQSSLAAEAARSLGTKQIWFNTGTFTTAYASDPKKRVSINALNRQQMLSSVVSIANKLRSQGFSLSVHLFAEDKSNTAEGIDWSYWHAPSKLGNDAAVFKTFQRDLQANRIKLWLFDAA